VALSAGTTPGLAAKGIKNTGSSSLLRNGPVVTAGGLIFIASQADRIIHAYDKDTGKLLWERKLMRIPTESQRYMMPTGVSMWPFLERRLKDKHKGQHQHRNLEGTSYLKRQDLVRKAIMFLPCRKKKDSIVKIN